MQKDINILLIEDELNMQETLKDILTEENYKVTCLSTIALAKKELPNKFYNIALVDLKLPDGSGLELLNEIKNTNEETMVIIFTGFASLETAIAAVEKGTFAYLKKPVNVNELKITIKKALQVQELSLNNKDLLLKLKDLSIRDPLTGLYNYRYLNEVLPIELKRAKRYIASFSIAIIDIDYFKSVNDAYGHQYGDIILISFAKYLTDSIRVSDTIIRYGGDEFLIIMPNTNKNGAFIFAETLLCRLNEHTFDPDGNKLKLKITIGISDYPAVGIDTEIDLLNSADIALRYAKELGGNRVCIFKGMYSEESIEKESDTNVEKLKEKLTKMGNRVNQTLLESIYAFTKTIEARDYYTGTHAENMVLFVTKIGKKLKLSDKEIEDLERAAILHDLGKIGVPDNILHKKIKLTKKEYKEIKKHPQIGAEIIRSIHFLNKVVPIVLHHHERFDGSGYPSGLKEKEIPLGARIVAVADVYQALISDRPYRKAFSKEEAVKIIKNGIGTQFDPKIVKEFLFVIKQENI